MKKIYLLPFNEQDVQFSFDENVLKNMANTIKGLPHNKIFVIEVEDDFAQKLENAPDLNHPYPSSIPEKYYKQYEKYLDNPPEWDRKEGIRIYIIFSIDKRCYWSSSGNNLNSYHKNQPKRFFHEAIRIPLDRESYIKLYGYCEFICDNF